MYSGKQAICLKIQNVLPDKISITYIIFQPILVQLTLHLAPLSGYVEICTCPSQSFRILGGNAAGSTKLLLKFKNLRRNLGCCGCNGKSQKLDINGSKIDVFMFKCACHFILKATKMTSKKLFCKLKGENLKTKNWKSVSLKKLPRDLASLGFPH